jgi:hypothetical protein
MEPFPGKNRSVAVIGLFQIVKLKYIGLFILIWNILIWGAMLLDGSFFGQPRSFIGYAGMSLAGAFLLFSGLAPVLSKRIRSTWCKPERNFESEKGNFLFLAIMGFAVFFFGGMFAIGKFYG